MRNKPYVFVSAAYVHENHTPRFGLDQAEYDALIEGLSRLEAEQFEALADSPRQVQTLTTAITKLRSMLADPGPARPHYTLAQLLAERDPSIPMPAEEIECSKAPMDPLEGKP
jgi:hypothetical protein